VLYLAADLRDRSREGGGEFEFGVWEQDGPIVVGCVRYRITSPGPKKIARMGGSVGGMRPPASADQVASGRRRDELLGQFGRRRQMCVDVGGEDLRCCEVAALGTSAEPP